MSTDPPPDVDPSATETDQVTVEEPADTVDQADLGEDGQGLPDRLPEEQARGMTIDLGFAHARIEDCDIWFDDVPGHERFIRNMVAGATGVDVAMLVIADLLGVPVVRPRQTETTALGAAFFAGLAVGIWRDPAELASHWQAERVFEPTRNADWRTARLTEWHRAVDRARGWAMP